MNRPSPYFPRTVKLLALVGRRMAATRRELTAFTRELGLIAASAPFQGLVATVCYMLEGADAGALAAAASLVLRVAKNLKRSGRDGS